ncbi:MAG: O-antigen ligase family protein [Deltaproteobacteria bacterium]|nr:O-antigen ligase family protein [Deltaproteobacteria bacterium]
MALTPAREEQGLAAQIALALALTAVGLFAGVWWAAGLLVLAALLDGLGWRGLARAGLVTGVLLTPLGPLLVVLGLPVTLGKVAVGLSLLLSIARGGLPLVWTPLSGPLLAVLVSMGLATLVGGWQEGLAPLSSAVLLVVFVHHLPVAVRREQVYDLTRVIGAVLLLLLAVSIPQGLNALHVTARDVGWRFRSSGHTGSPNDWAMLLLLLVPVASWRWPGRWGPWAEGALLALWPIALLQTMSRSGFLVGALLGLWFAWRYRRRWRLLLLVVALVVVGAKLGVRMDGVEHRLHSLVHPDMETKLGHASLRQRADLVRASWTLFQSSPWLGVGLGRFPDLASALIPWGVTLSSHNTWLKVAVEQGVAGLVAHGAALWALARLLLVRLRSLSGRERQTAAGIVAGLAATGLLWLTADRFDDVLSWLVLGLALALSDHEKTEN